MYVLPSMPRQFTPSNNEGTWRTLSTHEWNHILTIRAGASDKVGYATVNGVHGIIILSDGEFADPAKNTSTKAHEKKFVPKATTEWDSNVYSADDWKAMQSSGAVFLPAAGDRNGVGVSYVGDSCYYWTSSSGNPAGGAYYVRFKYNEISPSDRTTRRQFGCSVRLVTDCK